MDHVEAMRCLRGSKQNKSVLIAFEWRRQYLKRRRDATRGWSTLTGLDHLLECGLMCDPIARLTENHARERSATSPIQTVVYCPQEMDLLRGTMVNSRLMPKDKSLSRTA